MRRRLLLALPLVAAGCAVLRRRKPAKPVPPVVKAVLGPPYQAGGTWRYPHASYDSDETGLAEVVLRHAAFATDGAPWDAGALMAAHPTLQLPAVASVTNLETGRQIVLRIDDRGPQTPGRLLALSPRAAALLGPGRDFGVLRVRVAVVEAPSRQLAAELGDPEAPALAITAAPVEAVQTESLGAPGAPRVAPVPAHAAAAATAAVAALPLRLPESVAQAPVYFTQLWIDAGGVGQPRYANLLRDRLAQFGAIVLRDPLARPEVAYRVRIGPFDSAQAADATLDRMSRAGVVDARIIVA